MVEMLEALDHPFLFIAALTIAVFAMAKLLAYMSGRLGLAVVHDFFVMK